MINGWVMLTFEMIAELNIQVNRSLLSFKAFSTIPAADQQEN